MTNRPAQKAKPPLAVTHPEVAAQWHPTKNGDREADSVVAGSERRVWWKCPKGPGHEWQTTPASRTRLGSGCPFCAGQRATRDASLAALFPEVALQWHPTKNGDQTPDMVLPKSNRPVWWNCTRSEDHEWCEPPSQRLARKSGCPFCSGRRSSKTTSLAALFPTLASQWHGTKNGDLTPNTVVARSGEKVWWICSAGRGHEWEARVSRRVRGSGCPFCARQRVTRDASLAALFPEVALQWHPTKNGDQTPTDMAPRSGKRIWWRCDSGPDHEWQTTPGERTSRGSGCPFCAGLRVSTTNSLATLFPRIAAEWHPTKNGNLTPDQVVAGTEKKVWWKCPKGPDHEWLAMTANRTRLGHGCPFCAGLRVSTTNSLATLFPRIAAEWHPTRNGNLTPDRIVAGSEEKVWWKCPKGPDHEWMVTPGVRAGQHSGCPFCANRIVSTGNSLATLFPRIAAEWHSSKNGNLTPGRIVAGSNKKVWWLCPESPDHEWQATVVSRTRLVSGCPYCNQRGWTVDKVRAFISSLRQHIGFLSPAERWVIFQQSGLLQTHGAARGFVKALATGRFPIEEVDRFIAREPSLVDEFVEDVTRTLEPVTGMEASLMGSALEVPNGIESSDDVADRLVDEADVISAALPIVEAKDVLGWLDSPICASADQEAVEFLLASAPTKMWKHAFQDEDGAVTQAEDFDGDEYAEKVRSRFLDEYRRAVGLSIPPGYRFEIHGLPAQPNLMQRYVATRVQDSQRLGNWSGTGAGKTLSAILAARLAGAGLTVICCPNSSVDGWRREILLAFPFSIVESKTFTPDWAQAAGDDTGLGSPLTAAPRYLILNFEAFQRPDSARRVKSFVESERIDFVVVDEIHFAKQRAIENISRRRQLVGAMVSLAGERNPDLHVLGMSATPVINNLQEGKSLIELVTGVGHDELDTRPTIPNCMALHQRLVTVGVRWMPEYDTNYKQLEVPVDCSPFLEEIRALGQGGTVLQLEQILTRARLPVIREHVRRKTLIYTHYIQGIDRLIRDALQEDGWKVGFYTGEEKSGLNEFIEGDLDVLIGSSAIATGLDGLQQVCSRLIVNVLPWTAAEFDQLKGRIFRQGQREASVTMVIPLTYAAVNGQHWSWCESKMQRLRFKRSIADAAVDGIVPEGHLRTPAQAYQDLMAWLERLYTGDLAVITRPRITIPLPDLGPADTERRVHRYGDFSSMNRSWNQARSSVVHERLQKNPEEWAQYHTLYQEARSDWAVVPYKEMIRWCQKRSGYVIGDFGCGEAKLAEAVSDRHTVYSFDHVAVNEDVVACDMAHTHLADETLDVAIFALSFMGSNVTDYLKEAHRALKLDGQLHIIEATSRFSDRAQFAATLGDLGFEVMPVTDMWKFTHIRAIKTDRPPKPVELRF
jgi:Hypothetical methyltransferase/Probable Zinc-ribbon domain/Helicase conserved C-terminal domain